MEVVYPDLRGDEILDEREERLHDAGLRLGVHRRRGCDHGDDLRQALRLEGAQERVTPLVDFNFGREREHNIVCYFTGVECGI